MDMRRMAWSALWQPLDSSCLRSRSRLWDTIGSDLTALCGCRVFLPKRALGTTQHDSRSWRAPGRSQAGRSPAGRKCQVLANPRSHLGRGLRLTEANAAVKDRQVGVLLERLPYATCSNVTDIARIFLHTGIHVDAASSVLVQRNSFGAPMGRAIVLTRESLENADFTFLPPGSSVRLLDHFDVEAYVERWERFRRLSDDLRWLARPEHFPKTVTITEIPSSYGRRALRDVLERYANVKVNPTDIVFQFDKRGQQKDVAWVVCRSEKDANRALDKIQELPVPKRVQYAGLFGCAFLWSRRSSLFITHSKLDFELHRNRSQVFTCGWDSATEADDVQDLLIDQHLCPSSVLRVENGATGDVGFLLEYPTMMEARSAMVRLDRFKHQWKLPQHQVIYAFPRQANVKYEDEKGFYATEEESDSDIDDPIDY